MNKLQRFIIWLDGYLDDKESLDKEQTSRVSEKLDSLFEHEAETKNEITSTFGLDFGNLPSQSTLHKHDIEDGEVKYRC